MRVTVSTVYPQSLKPKKEIYLDIHLQINLEKLGKKREKATALETKI